MLKPSRATLPLMTVLVIVALEARRKMPPASWPALLRRNSELSMTSSALPECSPPPTLRAQLSRTMVRRM